MTPVGILLILINLTKKNLVIVLILKLLLFIDNQSFKILKLIHKT